MKISLNWIRDYVALDAAVPEITRAITFLGFEVEHVASTGAPRLEHVVVGEVLTRDRHPNADKLSVCKVDIGPAGGVRSIVCGAQNYKVGGPGPRGAARRGAPRRLQDQAVQDPRRALRRDALLGQGARNRRGPGRPPHPRGPPGARRADQRRAAPG